MRKDEDLENNLLLIARVHARTTRMEGKNRNGTRERRPHKHKSMRMLPHKYGSIEHTRVRKTIEGNDQGEGEEIQHEFNFFSMHVHMHVSK